MKKRKPRTKDREKKHLQSKREIIERWGARARQWRFITKRRPVVINGDKP